MRKTGKPLRSQCFARYTVKLKKIPVTLNLRQIVQGELTELLCKVTRSTVGNADCLQGFKALSPSSFLMTEFDRTELGSKGIKRVRLYPGL